MAELPVEVELVYEVMPCNAMRVASAPAGHPHPCGYFRRWGTYHGYDYDVDGPPPQPGIVHASRYVGRVHPVPELLSGCRKAPLMAIGINPNLPGWWPRRQHSLTPLFDDYHQYAHYFRYRSVAKLEIPRADYERFGGGEHDGPFSDFELDVPAGPDGVRSIPVRLQPQRMYQIYQGLLDELAERMGWQGHQLSVGEDLSYGNMVASASAKWTVVAAPDDPDLPPMTPQVRDGIVTECFRDRRFLPRQLFQSLPAVILVLGQSTANAVIEELGPRFTVGAPEPREPVTDLLDREVRLRYGTLPDSSEVDARVVFAPHATGNPQEFAPVRSRIVAQLVAEARAGRLVYRESTGHLSRPRGACVFCPMLQIGPCDYVDELEPLSTEPSLTADGVSTGVADRRTQLAWVAGVLAQAPPVSLAWAATDDGSEAVDPVIADV